MAHPAITNLKGKLVGAACANLAVAILAVVEVWVCGVVVVVVVVDAGSVYEDAPAGVVWAALITRLDGIDSVGILPALLLTPPVVVRPTLLPIGVTVVPGWLPLVVGTGPAPVGVR